MPTQTDPLVLSESRSMRSFAWAWLVYAVFVIAVALAIWIPKGLAARMDFREMYAAGVLVRTDPSHLYDLTRQNQIEEAQVESKDSLIPFGHMAYEAYLFAPLSLLKYPAAYVSMILLNLALMALCFLAARTEFSLVVPLWQPRPGWIFFSFIPTSIALALGQDSLLQLLILCLTWKFLGRSKHFAAGMLLSLMLFKPHVAVLIGLFLAVRYGWRFVAGFAAGGALVTALSIPFLRHGGLKAWFDVLWGISLASGSNGSAQVAVATYPWSMPNLRGLLFTVVGGRISSHAFLMLVGVVSFAGLVWTLSKIRRLSPPAAFALSVIVAVLLSYSFEPSDCTILLLPALLMQPIRDKALNLSKHAMLGLPMVVLLLAPPTPPGYGFSLIAVPLILVALFLSRTPQQVIAIARSTG